MVMLFLRYVLFTGAIGFFLAAAGVLAMDVREAVRSSQPLAARWRLAGRLALIGWIPLLVALSLVVVPSGSAGGGGRPPSGPPPRPPAPGPAGRLAPPHYRRLDESPRHV